MIVVKAKISAIGSYGYRIIVDGRVTAELPAVQGCFSEDVPAVPGMDVVAAIGDSLADGVILGVM